MEMFSLDLKKRIPKKFEECVQEDEISKKLWKWAKKVDSLGSFLCALLILVGIMISIANIAAANSFEPAVFVVTIGTWGICVFIEFCLYHVLSLALGGLASIVLNTKITANIAIFNAQKSIETSNNCEETNTEKQA